METITVFIDDFDIETEPNISILDTCLHSGIYLPRFCYHESLPVAGNCRMCLVEVETNKNNEKAVAACGTDIEEDMVIYTTSPLVIKARENVIQTLLLNHPLDCPICDQAGECDLQDQAQRYGQAQSRFFFKKKPVDDKFFNPFIKTIMTRCISCTRCVRFGVEYTGHEIFGTLDRGGKTEIGTFIPATFRSEISACVIDLCPVGALTSQLYAFKGRPWELRMTESVDFTDPIGANVYINYRDNEVVRILPKINKELNDYIISDKARFNYDAQFINRIKKTYVFNKKKNTYDKRRWRNMDHIVRNLLDKNTVNFIVNHKTEIKTLFFIKKLVYKFPRTFNIFATDCETNNSNWHFNLQTNFAQSLQQVNGTMFFLGTNPKIESAILNAKIRFQTSQGYNEPYSFGIFFNYMFHNNYINLDLEGLRLNLEAKIKTTGTDIYPSDSPLIILGSAFRNRVGNIPSIEKFFNTLFPKNLIISLFYYLNTNSIIIANIKPLFFSKKLVKTIKESSYFLSQLHETIKLKTFLKKYNISRYAWHDTHGTKMALKSQIILPGPSFYENTPIYLNIEDRPQKSQNIVYRNKPAKDLKHILQRAYEFNLRPSHEIFFIKEMAMFNDLYDILKNINKNIFKKIKFLGTKPITSISLYPIFQLHKNFYCSDTFTKNSMILNKSDNDNLQAFVNFQTTKS